MLGHDEKRLHLFHTLWHGADGERLATGEHLLLHVDTAAGRALRHGREPVAALESRLPTPPTRRCSRSPKARARAIALGLEREQHDAERRRAQRLRAGRADALVEERHGESRRDDDARLAHGGHRRGGRPSERREDEDVRAEGREPGSDGSRRPTAAADGRPPRRRSVSSRKPSAAGIIDSSWYTIGEAYWIPLESTSV